MSAREPASHRRRHLFVSWPILGRHVIIILMPLCVATVPAAGSVRRARLESVPEVSAAGHPILSAIRLTQSLLNLPKPSSEGALGARARSMVRPRRHEGREG